MAATRISPGSRRHRRWVCAAVLSACLAFASPPAVAADQASPRLVVAAAASTLAALNEAIAAYGRATAAEGRPRIVPLYASSGALARQIIARGPAKIFISADKKWVDLIEKKNRLAQGSRRVLMRNSILLAAPAGSGLAVDLRPGADLEAALGRAGGGRLAIADPDLAPLGAHTREALQSLGLWDRLAPHLLRADDAAKARVLVERGAAGAGILYATDVAGNPRLRAVAAFPPGSTAAVTYEIAIIRQPGMAQPRAAGAFVDWLLTAPGQAVFARFGFTPAAGL